MEISVPKQGITVMTSGLHTDAQYHRIILSAGFRFQEEVGRLVNNQKTDYL